MLIDTHAHIMDDQFRDDFLDVIKRAKEAGVGKIINVGCGCDFSEKALKMLGEDECLYATLGLHPYDANDLSEDLMNSWRIIGFENKRIVAIGETGLDYVKAEITPEQQKKSFRRHLVLARELDLPVIVHNRGADDDCLNLLKEFNGFDGERRVEAVFHCYASDLTFARKAWAEGYFTSFTGIITFPNAEELRRVIMEAPMDKILVETDCPYLAPVPYRGRRNEPAYVVEVAKKIAELRSLSFESVVDQLSDNTLKLFKRLI